MQFIAVPAGKRVADYYKKQSVIPGTIFGVRNSFRLTARIGQRGSMLAQTKPGLKSTGLESALVRFRLSGCAIADTLYQPPRTVGERPPKGKVKTSPLRANRRVATIARCIC